MMIKSIKSLTAFLIAFGTVAVYSGLPVSVQASAYKGYIYDSRDEALPSRIGYLPKAVYALTDGDRYNGRVRTPQDFFISSDGTIYLLDSGNNRVLILDSEMRMKGSVEEFIYGDELLTLNKPTGIFVDSLRKIYIADPANGRVVVSDQGGIVSTVYGKPQTDLLSEELEFKPAKVLADSSGMVYITAPGIYQGAVLYRPDGRFEGFYGSNSVEITPMLLLDRFWKNILSSEQADNISRYIPEEFTSFDIDNRDFVYTVTQTASIMKKLKKLNPLGSDIMEEVRFGEREQIYLNGSLTASRFVDLDIGAQGYINVLDQQNNRVFQYDSEGNLLFIFGGTGQQAGTFLSPAAIETWKNEIYVLDSLKGNITVFSPTDFGLMVHEAIDLHNDGKYEEASVLWQQVLKQDRNYETAYRSIGKALMADKEYGEAVWYFRQGNDRKGNSDAFQAWRNQILQQNFVWIFIGFIVLIVAGVWLWNAAVRRKKEKERNGTIALGTGLTAILFHPVETSEEMKTQNFFPLLPAFVILLLWFIAVIAQFSLTGFRFNMNRPEEMNLPLLFLKTIPVFAVWIMANWGVCTLMDGKGRMREIFTVSAYALVPYVTALYIHIIASHFMTQSEGFILRFLVGIGTLWSVVVLLGVLTGIHEYSFSQTLFSVVLTVVGVLVVAFLILLLTSLFRQSYSFVYSVLHEILYRLR